MGTGEAGAEEGLHDRRLRRCASATKAPPAAPRTGTPLKRVALDVIGVLKRGEEVSVSEMSAMTCKRRCYDVILVLEAAGLVDRVDKHVVRWRDRGSSPPSQPLQSSQSSQASHMSPPTSRPSVPAPVFDDGLIDSVFGASHGMVEV